MLVASLWLAACGEQAAPAALCGAANAPVNLPGGTFTMGAADGYPEEGPVRQVQVTAFAVDSHEVTNARFAEFVDATGYVTAAERRPDPSLHPDVPQDRLVPGSAVFRSPESGTNRWWHFVPGAYWRSPEGPGSSIENGMNHPVVHVAHADAAAFAAWAGGRLPTEAEWEYAARGGLDQARYTWGAGPAPHRNPTLANTWQGDFPFDNHGAHGWKGTSPVGTFPANGYGLFDMAGNVWEWTESSWQDTPSAHCCCSGSKAGGDLKIIKGGSHLCSPQYCLRFRPAARSPQEAGESTSHLGFRCISRQRPE